MRYTVVWAADCDGGLQIQPICEWEDCCAAARRTGGTCYHGGTDDGGGATWEECDALVRDLLEREQCRRV